MKLLRIFCIANCENFENFYFALIGNGRIPGETLKLFSFSSIQNHYADYFCCLISM